jgi:hypothetical protein
LLKKPAITVLALLRDSTLRRGSSEVGSSGGAFPFAYIMDLGERKSPARNSDIRELLNDATCLREALRRRQGTPLVDFSATC